MLISMSSGIGKLMSAILLIGILLTAGASYAQGRQEVRYNYLPPQLTVTFQHTEDDYQLRLLDGSLEQVILNGTAVEYANRRFYPLELIGRASFSSGNPLGQKLETFTAGAGYTRQFARRFDPFVRVATGFARTSSDDSQYLYKSSQTGFAVQVYGGLDIAMTRRWGIRAIDLENQYLPYGVQSEGSVYWSYGAGAFFRF
jgi:hypothetical protein